MKLTRDAEAALPELSAAAREVLAMLYRGDVQQLVKQYGYALSHGRDPAAAIREDLARALAEVGTTALAAAPAEPAIRIKLFKREEPVLRAVVECDLLADNHRAVLVELIVTKRDEETHVTLEDITPVRL